MPAAALLAVTFYMSSRTHPPGRWLAVLFLGRSLSRDKPLHFIAYAAIAAAIVWPLWSGFGLRVASGFGLRVASGFGLRVASGFRLRGWSIPLAWLLASAFAALDEIHQALVPGRSGSLRDFLLDSSGALAGCVVVGAAYAVLKWRRGTADGRR